VDAGIPWEKLGPVPDGQRPLVMQELVRDDWDALLADAKRLAWTKFGVPDL
jgi:hypothetical protein